MKTSAAIDIALSLALLVSAVLLFLGTHDRLTEVIGGLSTLSLSLRLMSEGLGKWEERLARRRRRRI